MALDQSRFGTRISLSDRFSMVRKEAAKRSIVVNPSVDASPTVPRNGNKVMKDFNGTYTRADRPSAILQQGSERNKRLVYQMALAPSVLAEINQSYEPQIRAQLPPLIYQKPPMRSPAVYRPPVAQSNLRQSQLVAPQQKKNIKQRLGGTSGGGAIGGRISIKYRLGVKRTPVTQRIGLPKVAPTGTQNKNRNIVRNGNQMRLKNTMAFKKKNFVPKFNQMNVKQNGTKALRGNKPIGRKPVPSKPVTAAQLDSDLDVYMRNTKGFLNNDLDVYMAQV